MALRLALLLIAAEPNAPAGTVGPSVLSAVADTDLSTRPLRSYVAERSFSGEICLRNSVLSAFVDS